MNEYIAKYGDRFLDGVCDEVKVVIDLDVEPWYLLNTRECLNVRGTVWEDTQFKVDGYKWYDENGSMWVGLLKFDAKGKSTKDFYELARRWEKAEW